MISKPILEFLDNTYANIQNLSGYKKDIALFALGRTCHIRACFGEYSRSKKSLTEPIPDDAVKYPDSHIGNPSLPEFKELFVKCIHDANKLVFDNGQECRVFHQDAVNLLPKVEVDLVYADPPYMTQFGFNDYEDKLHFVEGLMTPAFAGAGSVGRARRSGTIRTATSPPAPNTTAMICSG